MLILAFSAVIICISITDSPAIYDWWPATRASLEAMFDIKVFVTESIGLDASKVSTCTPESNQTLLDANSICDTHPIDKANPVGCSNTTSRFPDSAGATINEVTDKSVELQPFYKNHYFIGVTIVVATLTLVAVIWYYGNYQDISDIASDAGSDTSSVVTSTTSIGSSTVVASEGSSMSASTLVSGPVSFSNNIPYYRSFRAALVNISEAGIAAHDISHFLPRIGNSIFIDYDLISYLRAQAEANSLNLDAICNELGYQAIMRMFENQLYHTFFGVSWNPSDAYPTYDSFYNDMLQRLIRFNLDQID